MLLLYRSKGEAVVIGEPPNKVIVTVCDIYPNKVKLGIEASSDITVVRKELLDTCDEGEGSYDAGYD